MPKMSRKKVKQSQILTTEKLSGMPPFTYLTHSSISSLITTKTIASPAQPTNEKKLCAKLCSPLKPRRRDAKEVVNLQTTGQALTLFFERAGGRRGTR